MIQTRVGLILFPLLLASCSLYSSAGRKQFEDKAPASLVQPVTLMGCRNLSSAEAWLKEEFPSSQSELVEMNNDYEVWLRSHEDVPWDVSVLTKHDSGEGDTPQICNYQFANRESWVTHRKAFLAELSNSLVDLN
ncbi:MAG: hypothetical protein H7326_01955 [Bdellovibrionaceae bacterium]|nr:hypothetical protein [Pseudobdellovibrionaceae bacterium]